MRILGKMMESGWQEDWEYLTKRLEQERTKRFAADKDKNNTKMLLRVAEREVQEEKRLRLELCQVEILESDFPVKHIPLAPSICIGIWYVLLYG